MKKQFLMLFILIIFAHHFSICQTGFEKLYAPYTNKGHNGYSIVPSFQSGYIIAGVLNQQPTGYCVLLMKINPEGDIVWTKTYGTEDYNASAACIQRTSDSCYIVCGKIGYIFEAYVLKINEDGDTLWTKKYSLPSTYTGTSSIYPTYDGGFILTGFRSANPGSYWLLMKIDHNGQQLWYRQYGDPNYDNDGNSVQETSDHGFIVAGEVSWNNGSSTEGFLTKTDSLGNLVWTKYFGNTGASRAKSVRQVSDGGYLCGGKIDGYACIQRTDQIGDTIWEKLIISDPSIVNSVYIDSDSTFVCCGSYWVSNLSTVFLKSFNYYGELKWSHNYTSSAYRYGFDVKGTADGGYVIVGENKTYASVLDSIYVIKTNENGIITGDARQKMHPYNKVNVFPNPNNGNFSVEWEGDYDQIEIIDHLSQRVFFESLNVQSCSKINVNLHSRIPGVYMLILSKAGKRDVFFKFILQ